MNISTQEVSSLMSVLASTGAMESLHSLFARSYIHTDHFKLGCVLVFLLEDKGLLPHVTHRLSALTLLHESFKGNGNPFMPLFLEVIQAPALEDISMHSSTPHKYALTMCERYFITQLLWPTTTLNVLKHTPDSFTRWYEEVQPSIVIGDMTIELHDYQTALKQLSPSMQASVSVIIPDPDPEPILHDSVELNYDAAKELFTDSASLDVVGSRMEPRMIRLPPPPLKTVVDELEWITPSDDIHTVLWDDTMCADDYNNSEIKLLMIKALIGPLALQQQQLVINALAEDVKLVYRVGLTPSKLPDLVENNPLIAIEVLMKLMPSSRINDYFSVLVNMDMSLHSMEVVNRLTSTVKIPTKFVHLYIYNCISSCETIKDRYMQSRLVRLVCVFLQSLIRNKIINVQDLSIEVETFCVEFARIKEASCLFRLLKTLDCENHPSASGSNAENVIQ